MALASGERLAHYEIHELIGAGGMGEVYRARDTRLDRDVAIKILPEELSRDPERMSRFEREAKLLAQLNHPNVATLHGLESVRGQQLIVMELIEGESLADRIASGPLSLDEAVATFQQIAEGLAVAHDKGIVHRDLKPANIKIGPDGTVKILDFGLAKVFLEDTESRPDSSRSPTLTKGTTLGVILGTASYMSPEQARGKAVDKRTDIWALGCCLYEALTGKRAFEGETVTDTLAAVIHKEPDFGRLPQEAGSLLRMLLRRCLAKDPKNRFHDAADVKLLLGEDAGALETRPTAPSSWKRSWAGLVVGAVFGVVLMSLLFPGHGDAPQGPLTEFTVLRPELDRMDYRTAPAIALAPDGSKLAYVATEMGDDRIFLRELDHREPRVVPGTERASSVFLSPDGEWIGFTSDAQLKKIAVSGQTPVTLASGANEELGAAWGANGMILYSDRASRQLMEVPEGGGSPRAITSIDFDTDAAHRFPAYLPDGRGILFTSGARTDLTTAHIFVQPRDGEPKLLIEGGTRARYAPTGHLLYGQQGTLMAVPFDLERLEVAGDPVPVVEGVQQSLVRGAPQFTVAKDGTLAYVPGVFAEPDRTLAWVDRTGLEGPLALPPQPYSQPRLSPSGAQVALGIGDNDQDVWIYDVGTEALRRLTFGGSDGFPVWTPDGSHIVFQSRRESVGTVYRKPADGSGPAERLLADNIYTMPHSFTPNGDELALVQVLAETVTDLAWIDMANPDERHEYLATDGAENSPMFSPDGRFLAYRSSESGQSEIYVQPFPPTGAKWQVSTDGGGEVVWARDGRELFYRNGAKFLAVDVSLDPVFSAGRPRILFEADYERTVPDRANYDVDLAGEQFLVVKAAGDVATSREIVVVLNWAQTLRDATTAR